MKVIQNKEIAWQEYDGEAVLVDSSDGVCRVLNDTATVIWNTCKEAVTIEEIVAAVCAEFDGSVCAISEDVEETVREFIDKNLLKEV